MWRRSDICKTTVGPKSLLSVMVGGLLGTCTATRRLLAELPSSNIEPIVQATEYEAITTKFRPYLFVNGCYPYSAVDAEGNTSEGLRVDSTTGRQTDCTDKDLGQLYVRYQEYEGHCAIMYMWYFPKDVAVDAAQLASVIGEVIDDASALVGHRHDFESTIVWATSCDASSAELFGVSHSGHGGYHSYYVNDPTSDPDIITEDGSYHPEVTYAYHTETVEDITHRVEKNNESDGLDADHLGLTTMIEWDALPAAALEAISTNDWGSAGCLMCDAKFEDQLERAWFGYEKTNDAGMDIVFQDMDDFGCDNDGESGSTLKGAVFLGEVDDSLTDERPGVTDAEYCWNLCDSRDEAYLEEFGYHGCNLAMFWEGNKCDLLYIPQAKWNSGQMKIDSTGAFTATSKVFCREAWW